MSEVVAVVAPDAEERQTVAVLLGGYGPAGAPGVPAAYTASGVIPSIDVTSQFGITEAGVPYFNPTGVIAADAAVLTLAENGHFVLIKPEA